MPPKAKAGLRRPAARAAGHLRRPAAAVEAAEEAEQGRRTLLGDLSIAELSRLGHIWLKKAIYYGQEVDVAGKMSGVRVNDGNTFLELETTGTRHEGLLKAISGKKGRMISVHVCPPDCQSLVTDEFLIHGKEFVQVKEKDEAWFTNLVEVAAGAPGEQDELDALRRELEERKEELEGRRSKSPKKKKKDKKKKEEKGEAAEERSKKKRRSASSEDLEVGQKGLDAVFSNTGLDPNPKSRRKLLRKARRLGRSKKKKKKSSAATSSSSSSSSSASASSKGEMGSLFDSEKRMKTIWRRYPGSLAASALWEARQCLLTASGVLWDLDRRSIPPITTQYTRQHLAGGMSPALLQEALTVSAAMDHLLQGKIAATMDILAQRLKSLESLSRGTHWSIGRQLELIRSDPQGITGEEEGLKAARAAREEEKLKTTLGKGGSSRTTDYGGQTKGKKGKESKGHGRTGGDDAPRGKGGAPKKDGKQEWGKKEK